MKGTNPPIYTDLWAYTLSENDGEGHSGPRTQWIQYLPRGQFKHPRFGDLNLGDKLFRELKENFDNKVRRIDPAMDRDHAPDGNTEALAWFKEAEIRPDGLWLLVEYTPLGFKLVHETKQFRYFSPEWGPFTDARTGDEYDNVITGGAATNRPFLKELAPLAASEHWLIEEGDPAAPETTAPVTVQLGDKKKKKKARTASAITCSMCAASMANGSCPNCGYQMSDLNTAPVGEPAATDQARDKAASKATKALSEVERDNKKLSEALAEQAKQLAELQTRLKESEVDRQLKEWANVELTVELKDEAGEVAETKTVHRTLAPRLAEMYKGVMLGEKDSEGLTLKDFIDEGIRHGGFVTLGEIGDGLNPQRKAPDDNGRVDTVKYLGETYEVKGMDQVRLAEDWARSQNKDFNDPVVKMAAFTAVSRGERAAEKGRSY